MVRVRLKLVKKGLAILDSMGKVVSCRNYSTFSVYTVAVGDHASYERNGNRVVNNSIVIGSITFIIMIYHCNYYN